MSARPVKTTVLSPRDLDILLLMADGKKNQDIADELGISINTVRTYNQRIFDKLDVNNRARAVARGYELGYITTEH